MPIFHRKAYEVACSGQVPAGVEFRDLNQLGRALDRLQPEQRCDALYADWLMRLNSDRLLILPLRDRLIDQGALAANYLAELAQNADDAAEGREVEIRVIQQGEWLFVSNDSRSLTSRDLFGLCRFFGHGVELTEETIGKFGIGFKSSYRIATEVFVSTWRADGCFSFRLPICKATEVASHSEPERLKRLIHALETACNEKFDEEVWDVGCLGYCTPEFCPELPAPVAEMTERLVQTKRGTLFCFHIRPDRLAEVQNRISGQVHQLYELCPLFLRHLRIVQLGPNELQMQEHRHDNTNDLPGQVQADRVTLKTQPADGRVSNSCFWRLRGSAPGDAWAVAFHANHEFLLRVEREDDEQGPTLKDGAAYAFFPLNSVNWPFRLHFHIDLPTNLARDNWNSADDISVKEQMRRAVGGLASWLEQHTGKWHPNWRIESLIDRRPNQNEQWAWHFWECLREEMCRHKLVRTLTGGFSTSVGSSAVALMPKAEARKAWGTVLTAAVEPKTEFQLVEADPDLKLVANSLTPGELADLCVAAAQIQPRRVEIHQAALTALLGLSSVSLRAIEDVIDVIVCDLASGELVPLEELFQQPGGAELTESWHDTFKQLARWAAEAVWRDTSVCGDPLRLQLEKLATPVFNPTWRELANRMKDERAWTENGDGFWKSPRAACPETLRESVLGCMRVPDGNGKWLPLANLWLDDDTPTVCFSGLLESWPLSAAHPQRRDLTAKLRAWGLFDAWEKRAKSKLKTELAGAITVSLTDKQNDDAIGLVFDPGFEQSRKQLDDDWKLIINESERVAVRRFIEARQRELKLSDKVLLSPSIPESIRVALALIPEYIPSPAWLNETAWLRIAKLGLADTCNFTFLDEKGYRGRKEELAKDLLEQFHRWKAEQLSDLRAVGLNEICGTASARQRSDWYVGLSSQKRVALGKFFAGAISVPAEVLPTERLNATQLNRATLHVDPLPSPLDIIPSLVESAVNLTKLRCVRDGTGAVSLEREQVAEILASNPDACALADQNLPLSGAPQGLRLRWFHGEQLVAELADVDVACLEGALVFGRYSRPAAEAQYVRLLSLYELSDIESQEYRKDKRQGMLAFDLYSRHREQIVDVLVKKHVKEVGYQREHVFRELLQNSESAYASKKGSVEMPWVEFRIEKSPTRGELLVRVRHAGRTFNESDRDGHPRPDIERIIRINAPNQNTAQELGRFNRGFKSVFTVAESGKVRIRSGAYKFEIQDLLLLSPAEPRPEQPYEAETEFEFSVSMADALAMLHSREVPTARTPPRVVNPTSLIFLSQLRQVKIAFQERSWEWQIARKKMSADWVRVEVKEATTGKGEIFWVCHGKMEDGKRFGVAIRVDKSDLPHALEEEWHNLRLTFETECPFGFDVLINGDFDADQGRVNLRSLTTSGADIIRAALNAALERSIVCLNEAFSKASWVAWAKALHLKDAHALMQTRFGEASPRFESWITRLEDHMTSAIPCITTALPLREVEFPTRLMRRLAGTFARPWGLVTNHWIEHEAEAELPERIRDGKSKISLPGWLSELMPLSPVLYVVHDHLQQPGFETLRKSLPKPERDELAQAEKILEEKLRPVTPHPEPEYEIEIELPQIEAWTVERLYAWWENQSSAEQDYTLEGANWALLYPEVTEADRASRVIRIKRDLLAPDSDAGRRVWYRLFGLACLMSAGRRTSEVRQFWVDDLEARGFWADTSEKTFADRADRLFEELANKKFRNVAAAGERAYFWRRIFYDVRKIHALVWVNDFPSVMMEVANRADHGRQLIEFLRSGRLPGQEAWVGVFGQSAGAPLFFLIRELRRLSVIENQKVNPLAFFACTPVRRAAARIGWLDDEDMRHADFASLASVSERLHELISEDAHFGPKLLPFFDIPLLHLGINGK